MQYTFELGRVKSRKKAWFAELSTALPYYFYCLKKYKYFITIR